MQRSLLNQSEVNLLLAGARQYKEANQQVMPVVLLADNRQRVRIVPLPDLAGDADARREQLRALGKQYPETAEALFIGESWFVAVKETADALKVAPSQHPSRQEAVFLWGRNRANSKRVSVLQPFTHTQEGIRWRKPQVFSKTGALPNAVDLIFAP